MSDRQAVAHKCPAEVENEVWRVPLAAMLLICFLLFGESAGAEGRAAPSRFSDAEMVAWFQTQVPDWPEEEAVKMVAVWEDALKRTSTRLSREEIAAARNDLKEFVQLSVTKSPAVPAKFKFDRERMKLAIEAWESRTSLSTEDERLLEDQLNRLFSVMKHESERAADSLGISDGEVRESIRAHMESTVEDVRIAARNRFFNAFKEPFDQKELDGIIEGIKSEVADLPFTVEEVREAPRLIAALLADQLPRADGSSENLTAIGHSVNEQLQEYNRRLYEESQKAWKKQTSRSTRSTETHARPPSADMLLDMELEEDGSGLQPAARAETPPVATQVEEAELSAHEAPEPVESSHKGTAAAAVACLAAAVALIAVAMVRRLRRNDSAER